MWRSSDKNLREHSLSTVRGSDRIVLLKSGQISQLGDYHELAAALGDFGDLLAESQTEKADPGV